VVAGEEDRLNQVEATEKAKRRRFITVCVLLARITWLVTRVTLIGAGTAMWLVVRLVSSRSWPSGSSSRTREAERREGERKAPQAPTDKGKRKKKKKKRT
jgi:hypothetical protein